MTRPTRGVLPLAPYGIYMTMAQFGNVVMTQFEEDFPGWSVDKLVVNPQEAIRFCNSIQVLFRTAVDQPIPDDVILRALMATRKQGKGRREKPPESPA